MFTPFRLPRRAGSRHDSGGAGGYACVRIRHAVQQVHVGIQAIPIAFTRAVSPRLAECALTHLDRVPIDAPRAEAQHAAYEAALRDTGWDMRRLPPLPEAPDGVFVEDTALLLDGQAIMTRPGIASRALEVESTAAALAAFFPVHRLAHGRLDGGDVLRIGRALYIGRSARTDEDGIAALREVVGGLGFSVVPVAMGPCLHLKSAVTWLGADAAGQVSILVNPAWIDTAPFAELDRLEVDPGEPWGANTLRLGGRLLVSAAYPRTNAMLRERGYDLRVLDVSELHKAEAALTCMSLFG
jgi:dimethylargininase